MRRGSKLLSRWRMDESERASLLQGCWEARDGLGPAHSAIWLLKGAGPLARPGALAKTGSRPLQAPTTQVAGSPFISPGPAACGKEIAVRGRAGYLDR